MTAAEFDPFAGGEILRVVPTTGPQREIIASAQMSDEANTAFNEAVAISIDGVLDRDKLERCLNRLIERHDILRATFSRRGDELCLQEFRPVRLDSHDLRGMSAQAQAQEIADLCRNIAISPMNLEEGPLLFFWLMQLDDQRHELIMAAHHIICDGWSIGLLLKELAEIYRIGDDNLSPADSFFDFAEQNEATQIANTDIDYWREQFNTVPPTLDLPLDYNRPTTRTFEASRFDYSLPSDLVAALPKAAAAHKASLVNFVMAGYFALLYRLTGNDDIVVGLPVAGQAALNRPNLLGHMVQLLPVRLHLDKSTTFRDLVAAVKRQVLNASEHPNFTFGKLIEGMSVDRSRVPLISTIFNIDQPMPPLDFGGAQGNLRSIPRAAENFEIFLNVVPSPKSLLLEATYSTALFSDATIGSWLCALQTILQTVVSNADVAIGDLALTDDLPAPAKAGNKTAADIPFDDLVSAFSARVAETPQAVAVICGESALTYAQLNHKANALAVQLSAQGVGDGAVVGVCCQRSERMLAAVLAVLKLGAAYLPLDPDFPPERLLYMLQDSGAIAVLEDDAAPMDVRSAALTHIDLDAAFAESAQAAEPPFVAVDPQRLAYIIYTSGSTGQPKGVRVHNRAMMNFLASMAREPGCNSDDRLLAVTTLSFDISVLELYLPLYCGAAVVIATRDEVKDGEKLATLIAGHNISLLQATPSTWRLLLASSWREQAMATHNLKALCGGEPLPQDLLEQLLPLVSELWNMFGPTETTVWSTCKRMSAFNALITVGKPIANTQVYVLSESLQALPLSVPGELCIGGEGVSLGYHDRPALTGERFVEHAQFGRIYRTGDLAKLLPNGEVQHLGRLDDQVKVRGYRIELGEIEAVLTSIESIAAAAVYLWKVSGDDVRIVACCVPAAGHSFQTVAVRKRLRELLPAYMVPQYLLTVDAIPLTPNNKVDRRALPRPEINESSLLAQSVLISDTERTLAKIWTDLIKPRNPIGRDDNFFEVGGHSLLALEAIRQIESATGKRFTPAEIVAERLATLAEKISAQPAKSRDEAAGPTALSGNAARHLSAEQERLLKRQLQFPKATCNNLPAAWLLEGELNVAAFCRSIARVFERQTALRTLIAPTLDGEFRQQLLRSDELKLPERVDCSDQADPLATAMEHASELATAPFSTTGAPLVRVALYDLSPTQHLLVLVPHQLIFDGWSFDIFLSELEQTYQAFAAGRAPASNALKLEFRDYGEWSRNRQVNAGDLAFHRRAINSARPLGTLVDTAASRGVSARLEIPYDQVDLDALEAFSERHHLRLHEILFAAFASAVAKVGEAQDIVLGVPVTGRYNADVIGLIGSFVSTLPCEVRLRSGGFAAVATDVSAQLKEFHEHQDVSLAEVISGTAWEKQPFPAALSASFGFQDVRNRPRQLAGLGLKQIDMVRVQTEVPIEFWCRIHSSGYLTVFDYDSGLVGQDTITSLQAEVSRVLKNLTGAGTNEGGVARNTIAEPNKKPFWRRLFQ